MKQAPGSNNKASFAPVMLFLIVALMSIPVAKSAAFDEFLFIPIVFYTPETSLAFGVSPLLINSQTSNACENKSSSINALFIYTVKKQFQSHGIADFNIPDSRWKARLFLAYRYYPDKFYGLGNETTMASEEEFTANNFRSELGFRYQLCCHLHLGLELMLEYHQTLAPEAEGLLANGTIPGTGTLLPGGAGITIDWDSRDDAFFSTSGFFAELGTHAFRSLSGSDFRYCKHSLDIRAFLPFAENFVLALQFYGVLSSGELPFFTMPLLGGPRRLRGYYKGRFRDRNLLLVQSEIRWLLTKRWSLAIFAATGEVASRPRQFSLNALHPAGGLGLRFRIHESGPNLRFDVGLSQDDSGVYVLAVSPF